VEIKTQRELLWSIISKLTEFSFKVDNVFIDTDRIKKYMKFEVKNAVTQAKLFMRVYSGVNIEVELWKERTLGITVCKTYIDAYKLVSDFKDSNQLRTFKQKFDDPN